MLVDSNKNGNRYMMPFFDVVGQDRVQDINTYMELPHDGMAPKAKNDAKLEIAAFGTAFGIDFSRQLDIKQDVIGQTGWAILGTGTDKRTGKAINTVKQFVSGA